MRKILALSLLCMRAVFRSRLFLSLLAVLLALLVGLALTVKGDGTLGGRVRVLLYYLLAVTQAVLGVATLWASCGALSDEIENRQITLVAVKPVRPFQVWLGKWLGFVALNAVLLAVSGVTIYALLRGTIARAQATVEDRRALAADVLVGRRLLRPQAAAVEEEAHALMKSLQRDGAVPRDLAHDRALQLARQRLLAARSVVRPGGSRTWRFDPAGHAGADLTLQYRFAFTSRSGDPVRGSWAVGTDSEPEAFTVGVTNFAYGAHHVTIPAGRLAPREPVVATYRNLESDGQRTVVFESKNGVEILFTAGGFGSNFARSLLLMLAALASLAALGITAGAMFSFPVATFCSAGVLAGALLVHASAAMTTPEEACRRCGHAAHAAAESRFEALTIRAAHAADALVEPGLRLNPVGPLSEGLLVSWGMAGRGALLMGLVYPALLCGAGALALRRRELGLPGTA